MSDNHGSFSSPGAFLTASPNASRGTSTGKSLRHYRDQAITALVPLMVSLDHPDQTAARTMAAELFDSYKAETPREMQLAAQIAALGWVTIACLSAGMVAKNESLNEMLRLHQAALALERLSQKATTALQALRQQRAQNPGAMTAEQTGWDDAAFKSVMAKARKNMKAANARLAGVLVAPEAATKAPRLTSLHGEPMTQAVLAQRRRQH